MFRVHLLYWLLTSLFLVTCAGNRNNGSVRDRVDTVEPYIEDIDMGHTAPAHQGHWVGYAAVGYR